MESTEDTNPVKKRKTWQIFILIVILGLAVNLILPKLMDINETVTVLRDMILWLVLTALVSEVLVYTSYGYSLKTVLDIQGHNLSVMECALIFISSYSIGIVAGGAITGLVALGFSGHLSQSQLVQYSVFITLLLLFSFGYLVGLAFPKTAFKVVNWVLWHWNHFRKKPYDPEDTQIRLNILFSAWKQMGNGNWWRPLLGTLGYYGFDLLAMYLIFLAAGYRINPGILFAGYGLPLLLAKMAFIVPGGLGIIETSMAALFTSLGVPGDIALVVILGYRLISFWIPVLVGFLVTFLLNRQQIINEQVYSEL